jgi:hypothetical protein
MKNSESTLMPWPKELLFLVEVRLDRLADLDAADVAIRSRRRSLRPPEDKAVGELDRVSLASISDT